MNREFGQQLRDAEFLLDRDNALINHGSWGTVPKRIFAERVRLMNELEFNPDHWYRRTLEDRILENIKAAAEFLHGRPEDCVLVVNATTGINGVLKSIPLKPEDGILIHSYTYNAIRNVAQAAADRVGASVLTVNIPLQIESTEQVIDSYRKMLEENPNIKIAVLDYISSSTGTLFPIAEIVSLCKRHSVQVMLDGAHSPGQLPVNLEKLSEMGVDFYTGNFHKWVLTPRGCALLWINPKHHTIIQPAITSHCYHDTAIQKDFFTQGTKDDTPFLCVKAAIEFYKELGGLEKIHAYSTSLMDQAVDMLVSAWGTQRQPIPKEMEAPFLRLVEVPEMSTYPVTDKQAVVGDMNPMMITLYERFHVSCAVLIVRGKVWVRLSAFVYNTMGDYEKLRDAVLVLKQESLAAKS